MQQIKWTDVHAVVMCCYAATLLHSKKYIGLWFVTGWSVSGRTGVGRWWGRSTAQRQFRKHRSKRMFFVFPLHCHCRQCSNKMPTVFLRDVYCVTGKKLTTFSLLSARNIFRTLRLPSTFHVRLQWQHRCLRQRRRHSSHRLRRPHSWKRLQYLFRGWSPSPRMLLPAIRRPVWTW